MQVIFFWSVLTFDPLFFLINKKISLSNSMNNSVAIFIGPAWTL